MPWFCQSCGCEHDDLPLAFGFDAPFAYEALPKASRWLRGWTNGELCVVDKKHYFIRGNIDIPILGSSETFSWGVWASLSAPNFKRARSLWNDPDRVNEPPYFGWLNTRLRPYPETLNLKTMVHTRAVGTRPFIELEPTDHPLAIEQREGITFDRVHEIAAAMLGRR